MNYNTLKMIFTQKKACQKPDMPFVLNVKKINEIYLTISFSAISLVFTITIPRGSCR